MTKSKRLYFLFAFFLLISSHLSLQAQTQTVIRINGSGSCLDMLQPMITAYEKINSGIRIETGSPLGSSGAVKALTAGVLDAAAVSRQLNADEIKKGCILRPYGKTPMAFVVNKKIKKKYISTQEIEDIYSGKLSEWSNGVKIRPVLRPMADIDSQILQSLSPGIRNSYSLAKDRQGMITAITDPEAYNLIIKTPGGFGITALTGILVHNLELNVLPLNGVFPELKTFSVGSYPLAKEISFVTMPNTLQAAKSFIDFIYSPQGKDIARKYGVLTAGR